MCAQFMIRARIEELMKLFGVPVIEGELFPELPDRFLPHTVAPVIRLQDSTPVLDVFQFSLTPSWSKERRPRFATHNARIETVSEKATWKVPFARYHCLVPLTDFIEPIYTGEYAGNMVRFHTSDSRVLAAGGIYDRWQDPVSGESIESFAILTGEPSEFVHQTGHDRQPIFLAHEGWHAWLNEESCDPREAHRVVTEYRDAADFVVEIDRPLKAGWEKRKKVD